MENELRKLRQEIKTNYEANIAAIDHLLEGLPAQRKLEERLARIAGSTRPERSSGQIIEEIIKKSGGRFDIGTVLHWYRVSGNDVSSWTRRIISQVINTLKQRGEIEVLDPGKGRRSGVYAYCKAR